MKLKTVKMHNGVRHVMLRSPKGLGDVVAHVLHTGVLGEIVKAVTGMDKPCGGCQKRQETLNKAVPFQSR